MYACCPDTGSVYFALTRNQLKQLRLGDDARCSTTVILSRVQKRKYVEDMHTENKL